MKRPIALALALLMVLQVVVWCPITVLGADSATTEGKIVFPDGRADVSYVSTLKDNKDGSFTLNIDLVAQYSETHQSTHQRVTKNGTYTVERSGWYLLELWGGKGGSATNGGAGGDAGYVYAKVYLEKGQSLYYSIGGNGQSTSSPNSGGGANGGGHHGGQGSDTVGGGGGYSAVFLYNDNESYSEATRMTNVILIAGGGGGGGEVTAAVGGAGGNVFGGADGTVDRVLGSVYNGQNGQNENMDGNRYGIGGTTVPGRVQGTITGDLLGAEGSQPNDWFCDATIDVIGGAGGSGNLGGGGGGAGYCGGSGGVQSSSLWSGNESGGGGGSSFIATLTNNTIGELITTELSDSDREYLLSGGEAANVANANPNSVGGALVLTYLDEKPVDYLGNVSVSGEPSIYYNVNVTTTNGTVADAAQIGVTGVNLAIPATATRSEKVTITVTFTPKDGFAGGYNVPLLEDDGSILDLSFGRDDAANDPYERELDLTADCAFVNAPLNFTVQATSLQLGDEDLVEGSSTEYKVVAANLYTDNYAEIRGQLGSMWQYDFIKSISAYNVFELDGTTPVPSTDIITETTPYVVSFTVEPRTNKGEAKVGNIGRTTKSVTVRAFVVGTGTTLIWGMHPIVYSKKTTYENNAYVMALQIRSEIEATVLTNKTEYIGATNQSVSYDSNYNGEETLALTVPVGGAGYYFLQCVGGKGGTGAPLTVNGWFGQSSTANGGAGANGGNISGYVYLEEGDKLYYKMGAQGANGVEGSSTASGGMYSYIALERNETRYYLLIAGGGGGGGNATTNIGLAAIKGGDAESSNAVTADLILGADGYPSSIEYSGKNGENSASIAQNASGGKPGNNFKNSEFVIDEVSIESNGIKQTYPGTSLGETYLTSGAFHFECVYLPEGEHHHTEQATYLTDYTLATNVTTYFGAELLSTLSEGLEATPTVTYHTDATNKNGLLSISGIEPSVTQSSKAYEVDGTAVGTTYYSTIDFTLYIEFTPRQGFLGGNEVPLIESLAFEDLPTAELQEVLPEGLPTGMHLHQTVTLENDETKSDDVEIEFMPESDSVNVAISVDYKPDAADLSVQDAYYVIGDAAVALSEMAELSNDAPQYGNITSLPEWQRAFIEVVPLSAEPTFNGAPNVTTEYTFSYGLRPTVSAEDSQAAVTAPNEDYTVSKSATLYVQAPIEYSLYNVEVQTPDMEADGRYLSAIIRGNGAESSYTTTLKAVAGYDIPTSVTVKVNGAEISAYTYTYDAENDTGSLTISGSAIKGAVEIIAATTLTLTYVYEDVNGVAQQHVVEGLNAGDEIDLSFANGILNSSTRPGYTFAWNWGDVELNGDGTKRIMPAGSRWVYGTYTPNTFTVVINYTGAGNETPESVTQTVEYGAEYTFRSPAINGYKVDIEAISGILQYNAQGKLCIGDTEGTLNGTTLTFTTVTYTALQRELYIYYVNKLTGATMAETHYSTPSNNSQFSVTSPVIPGYTADQLVVSGTMTKDGYMTTVYYTPNNYKITFDLQGGKYTGTDFDATDGEGNAFFGKYVQFDAAYNYNPTTDSIDGLPVPYKEGGFTFKRWYYFDENNQPIEVTAQTLVTLAEDHVLYAEWNPPVIYVTVSWGNLDFRYDPGVWNPLTHTYEYAVNESAPFEPKEDGTNTISVSNGFFEGDVEDHIASTVAVYAALEYTSTDSYKDSIDVDFTDVSDQTAIDGKWLSFIEGQHSLTVTVDPYLTVDNDRDLPGDPNAPIIIGTCKVVISTTGGTSS